MVAIHCFLGADQCLKVENPAIAKRQFQFHTMRQDALKIADPEDFPEAINCPQIGFR